MNNNENLMNFNDKKYNNRRNIIVLSVIFLFLIIILIFLYFFYKPPIFGEKEKINYLNSFEVRGYELNKPFRDNVYEYSVDVSEDIVHFICDVEGNVSGCNESISLKNIDSYIHKIILKNRGEEQIYTIKINKITNENDELRIASVEGNPLEWTNNDVIIKINVESNNKIDGYSFDGGNTWQQSNEKIITENQVLNVIVKDNKGNITESKEVKIDRIDKEKPTAEIVKETVTKDKIVLKVIANDTLSGIAGISFNDCDFNNNDTFIIKEPGIYTALVKDNAGNITDKISINIKNDDFSSDSGKSEKILTATFDYNFSGTSKKSVSCKTESDSCEITAPAITRYGYEILGWSTDKNAKNAMYKDLQKITLKENKTYYAITKKTLSLTLEKNGASTIGSSSESCDIYNSGAKCRVKLPDITRKDGTVIGWSNNKDAKTASYKVGDSVVLTNNEIYYAITKKALTLTLEKNGASTIGSSSESCTIYNSGAKCRVKLPTITRENGTVIGWSNNKNATTASYKAGDDVDLSNNAKYYAITKKVVTATFDAGVAPISCDIFNTNESCEIVLPYFNKVGSYNCFWGKNPVDTAPEHLVKTKVNISEDINYYGSIKLPWYEGTTHGKVRKFDIQRNLTIGSTIIEYEEGIPLAAVNQHIELLNRIERLFPFIFVPGKVFVLQYNTYEQYSSQYGITIPFGQGMFIDIKYDPKINAIDENVTIHELAHAWDNYYNYKTGEGRIAHQSDFTEFYNLIKPKLYIEGDGSIIKITETFAAMVTNYYWHILGYDNSKGYYALRDGYILSKTEINELKTILEKYMTISNNNYK